jgi:biopolymer transport protein ExbD
MKRANSETDSRSSGMNDVNMTPLIDVSLVLVVILLLATPLAFESSFAVRRESTTARAATTTTESKLIEVTIVSADRVKVNRDSVPRNGLQQALAPLLANGSTRTVAVTCADSVSHGIFVDVLDRVRLSGARDIAVAGR